MDFPYRTALIVGTGPGISASLARSLAGFGVKIALAARNVRQPRSAWSHEVELRPWVERF